MATFFMHHTSCLSLLSPHWTLTHNPVSHHLFEHIQFLWCQKIFCDVVTLLIHHPSPDPHSCLRLWPHYAPGRDQTRQRGNPQSEKEGKIAHLSAKVHTQFHLPD